MICSHDLNSAFIIGAAIAAAIGLSLLLVDMTTRFNMFRPLAVYLIVTLLYLASGVFWA